MTLDAADKAALTGVRFLGAPKVADLIESMDAQYGSLPAMKQVNQTFASLAKADTSKLKALNAVLEKNPELAKKIQANLGKDPEAFRTSFLPAVFKNPEAALTLVDQQPKQVSQATPAAAPKAAPIVRTYGDTPEPVAAAAATADASKPAEAKASVPSSTKAPGTTPESRLAAKMEQLSKVPGYSELVDNAIKNPVLADAMKAIKFGTGSVQQQEETLDAILEKTNEDPELFLRLNKKLKENPGAISSFSGKISSNPKEAIAQIADFANDGPLSSMAGLFGGSMKGGKLDFGGMFKSFLSNPMDFLKGIVTMIISAVTGGYAKSGMHNILSSNVGMAGYDESVRATDAKPSSVYGPDGQPVTAQAATTVQDNKNNKTVAAPQQPA